MASPHGAGFAGRVLEDPGELEPGAPDLVVRESFPHTLLKMDSSDGRTWSLRSRQRKRYWREPTFRPEM